MAPSLLPQSPKERIRAGVLAVALVGTVVVAWTRVHPGLAIVPDAPVAMAFGLQKVGAAVQPTAMVVSPGGELFVAQQGGDIVAIDLRTGVGRTVVTLPGVVSGGETGLLGLALAPDWPHDARAFVNYTVHSPDLPGEKSADGLHTLIARLTLPATGPADPASVAPVLTFAQPYANHNSGALAFGPDGMLYAGVGDGGSGGDPQGHGQNTADLLGSILRLDVLHPNATAGYAIPADNPYVARPGFLPEIWAYGVRNPWGMHFDRGGEQRLYFADVGQDRYEEVDVGVAGGNYGWNTLEGTHGYPTGEPGPGTTVPPLAEYPHPVGVAVTGGVVVRDPALPTLVGTYLCADFGTGLFFGVRDGAITRLATTTLHPSTFADGPDGAVYVADYAGAIYRLIAPVPGAPVPDTRAP